ncbi:MAG: glutamyl-tRNA reductase [Flavobacteriaceae bacterium]
MKNIATKLYNVGLSYKKADVQTRGLFSISKPNQEALLKEAKEMGINGVSVISTCNRTELTGFAQHPYELIGLLCKYSGGSVEEFADVSNVFAGKEAIEHLFHIGTGLDSQILGDYEIVGQLKHSFKMSKDLGTTNAYLERLYNSVLQASKKVKNTTELSSGTTSVSYAAVQYLLDNIQDLKSKNILVFGLGEIGKNACKNVLEYTDNRSTRLINRTFDKAAIFAEENDGIDVAKFDDLRKEIAQTDILIVSTGSDMPTVTKEDISADQNLLILDLSMPENVAQDVKEIQGVSLVNLDELSKITDRTLERRKAEVPKAHEIINEHTEEFNEWVNHRKFTPAVNALKNSLMNIQKDEINFHKKKIEGFNEEHAEQITSRLIQKITTQFVKHLKDEDTSVNQSIDVISRVFNTSISVNDEDN